MAETRRQAQLEYLYRKDPVLKRIAMTIICSFQSCCRKYVRNVLQRREIDFPYVKFKWAASCIYIDRCPDLHAICIFKDYHRTLTRIGTCAAFATRQVQSKTTHPTVVHALYRNMLAPIGIDMLRKR